MDSEARFATDEEDAYALASAHGGSLNAKGSYNSLDFVVRIRPDLYKTLDALDGGVRFQSEPDRKSVV